jgi:hypothetical protein
MSTDVPPASTPPAPVSSRSTGWRRWRRPLLGLAALAGAWTAGIGGWLPGFLQPRIEALASETLGTPVSLQALHIRPWRLQVEAEGLQVGPGASPLMRVAHAEAQLSLESLWRFAPVLRHVKVQGPEIWAERVGAETFNFSPVLARLTAAPKTPPAPDESPARFAVFNIELDGGTVHYTDRVLQQVHVVDQIKLGVPFVSSLPSFVQVDVQPLLAARVDGSPLRIEGRTLPFADGMRSEVAIEWQAVPVSHWLAAAQPLLPAPWHVAATEGRLSTSLRVQFESHKPPEAPRLIVQGQVAIDQLKASVAGVPDMGPVQVAWQTLKVSGIDAQPLAQQVRLGELSWQGLQVDASAPASGPHAQAKRAGPQSRAAQATSAADTSAANPAKPWDWSVGRIRLTAERLVLPPLGQPMPWPTLRAASLDLDGLDANPKRPAATWRLNLRDEHDASVAAQGHLHPGLQTLDAQLQVDHLDLAPWLKGVLVPMKLPLRVAAGELGLKATVQARLKAASAVQPAELRVAGGVLSLKGLDLPATAAHVSDRVQLAALGLDQIALQVDLGAAPALRDVQAGELSLQGLQAAVTRGPGALWLGARLDAIAGSADAAATKPTKPRAAPTWSVASVRCDDCAVQLQDRTVQPAAHVALSQMHLKVEGLSQNMGQALKVVFDTRAQRTGSIQLDAQVRPEPLNAQGRLRVAGLDLREIQSYIDPYVNVRVAGARAETDGRFQLSQGGGRPGDTALRASYAGRVALNNLRVQDRVNDADFLVWRRLNVDGLNVKWAPDALDADLGRIALQDFYGRLIINPNGQLNLRDILRQQAGGETRSVTTPDAPAAAASAPPSLPLAASEPASAMAAASSPSAAPATAPKLRWQGITLTRGRIDFTDNYIQPNYSARLSQIQGTVSAVSSTQPEPATVDISGAVDDAAPLRIAGRLHPLGPRLYTDIEGSAKGIELTRLTPYAGRYAGYPIEKGTLSMTVHYKVDGGKLDASNQIYLDQLTFGEPTHSPDAVKLPVLLAVSLLKDRNGVIDINLPISGSLDDPQFSVGGIIWRVVVNLLTKAITAPFALLTGGGSEELGLVSFEPGSARLSDEARSRLDTLATKLLDRPSLKLEATGRVDPAVDTEGLRRAHVTALMRAAKARAQGTPLADTRIAPDERNTWLMAAYKAADIRKPRNFVGIAKTLPPAEMEALLQASATVDEAALRTLANQRGDHVKAYLAAKLPPERVLLTASRINRDGLKDDAASGAIVQFGLH